jgi:SAM-dependent methyltransferase
MTSAIAAIPADEAGAHTLEIMSAAPRYAAWQVEMLRPWLGRRVLEVGSGIGNISPCLRAENPELLVLSDTDPWYLNRLRQTFAGDPVVQFADVTLPDPSARERFAHLRLDSIVALNVLEHIQDDLGSLRSMARMAAPGGRVILLVPALPALYGTLDTELQHFRRYTRPGLRQLMEAAGLADIQLQWYNRAGIPGWWYNARIRKAPRVPLGQLKLFDRLVPLLRYERYLPLPFGQSLIAIGTVR